MTTNFFQSIEALQVAGNWVINIGKGDNGELSVAVLFYNDTVTDNARKRVAPKILRGLPQELDEHFFDTIGQPIKQADTLYTNMAHFEQQLEAARKHSKMEQDKQTKEDKDKSDKQRKYEDALKKADELEAAGKYRDAWMKLPDPAQYPEHADELKARKSALAAKFAPDLFNEPKTTQP